MSRSNQWYSKKYCPLHTLTLRWKVPKLCTVDALSDKMTPFDFQVTVHISLRSHGERSRSDLVIVQMLSAQCHLTPLLKKNLMV